jgi:hypothetical protein
MHCTLWHRCAIMLLMVPSQLAMELKSLFINIYGVKLIKCTLLSFVEL